VGRTFDIPVLHVEQLLALGLGAAPKDVGLDRHMVSTARLADRLDERRLLPA
jgi:succinate dehydrogenase / fumarate reductase cytochrome b subunit